MGKLVIFYLKKDMLYYQRNGFTEIKLKLSFRCPYAKLLPMNALKKTLKK